MITIFQLVRNETVESQLGFCIVKNWDGDRNPRGTFTCDWFQRSWTAHERNHNLIYTGR